MPMPTRRGFLAGATLAPLAGPALASAEIEARVDRALREMRARVAGAAELEGQAKGLLMMPNIIKGGLIFGGAYGEGALRVGGVTEGYYSFAAATFGFQLGVQRIRYALFFMTDGALADFRRADGWTVGADAEVTFPGDGVNLQLSSQTQRRPVIGVVFGQDGLMAGASFQGAKFSRIVR
ncbi:MAG: twin-arginine translocation pathway signal [Rhodobacteraceae bacterium]|nr:MAG: twin-arginine translocation pathway signal [Paracoccaceae bacterium]